VVFVSWGNRTKDAVQKTCAHEIGHALRILTRNGYDPTWNGRGDYLKGTAYKEHDLGRFPVEALKELNPLLDMVGIMTPKEADNREWWLRNEDWRPAWLTAKFYFQ